MTSFTAAQAGPSARRVGAHPLPGGREPLPAEALWAQTCQDRMTHDEIISNGSVKQSKLGETDNYIKATLETSTRKLFRPPFQKYLGGTSLLMIPNPCALPSPWLNQHTPTEEVQQVSFLPFSRDISVAVVRKLRGQTLRCSLDNWDLTKIDETILFACQAFVLWMQKNTTLWSSGNTQRELSSLQILLSAKVWIVSGDLTQVDLRILNLEECDWIIWTWNVQSIEKNPSNPAQIKTCNQHGNIVEHVPMVPSSFQRINLHKLP